MTIKFRAMQRECAPLCEFGSLLNAIHLIADKVKEGQNEKEFFIERKEFAQEDE